MFDFIPKMDYFPSRREFFGSTIKHLLRQSVRASGGGICRYRAEVQGRVVACAIGAWVPNKEYNAAMEGCSQDGLITRQHEGSPFIPTVIMLDGQFGRLVWELQQLHDSFMSAEVPLSLADMVLAYTPSAVFCSRANRLAGEFGLPVPFVKEPNSGQWQFTYNWCV